jgi:hypothetical protein
MFATAQTFVHESPIVGETGGTPPPSVNGQWPRRSDSRKRGYEGFCKRHIINTGSVPLKLYTLYAPPNHRDGVVHHTRADAEADHEHFDGKTTE